MQALTGAIVSCGLLLGLIVQQPADRSVQCQLRRGSDASFSGTCVRASVVVEQLVLQPPSMGELGLWRGKAVGAQPTGDRPVFLDLGRQAGTYRTVDAWYPITEPQANASTLAFGYDMAKPSAPTAADLDILRRARVYLSDAQRWKRDEGEVPNVICPTDAVARSLFCALHDASVLVDGEFFWGRPAASELRTSIIKASAPRRYQHWLTGFNNDPSTQFGAVVAVFDEAIAHVQQLLGKIDKPTTSNDQPPNIALQLTSGMIVAERLRARHPLDVQLAAARRRRQTKPNPTGSALESQNGHDFRSSC